MAITVTQTIADTSYRTTVKYINNAAANTDVNILDCSGLSGYQVGGLVNLAKISWWSSAPSGGLDLIWHATSNVIAFICEGASGTYGFMPGQPSITNSTAAAGRTGDVYITNATATFTLVIEYHKVPNSLGVGWGA